MKKRTLEKLQEEAGEICVFLGKNLCKPSDYEPQKCIHGDYFLCENYQNFYNQYKLKKTDASELSLDDLNALGINEIK
ncbi:MAG: hypothetical protein ACOCT9_00620 [archaeon]